MTGPGGDEVARVSVRVVPDTDRFHDELRRQLREIRDEDHKVDVGAELDKADLDRQLREIDSESLKIPVKFDVDDVRDDIERATAGVRADPIEVPVELDQDALDEALTEVSSRDADPIDVPVELDEAGLQAELARINEQIDHLSTRTATPHAELLLASFEAQRREVEAALAGLDAKSVDVPVEVKGATEARAEIVGIKAAAEALGRNPILLKFDLDQDQLLVEKAEIEAELEELNDKVATAEVRADIDAAQRNLRRIDEELDELDARRAEAVLDLDVDTLGADAHIREFIARQRGRTIHLDLDIDRDRLGLVTSGLAGSFANIGSSLTRTFGSVFDTLGAGANRVGGYLADMGEKFEEVGEKALGVAGAAAQIGALTAAASVAGAGLTAAYGAAATAVAALPGLLGFVAAAGGTVALGLDGIKKAAGAIKPEFDRLKASVSATFEHGLAPVFQQLATIFPKIEGSINGVAEALVSSASSLTRFVTSGRGLSLLGTVFNNTADAIRRMQPGIDAAVEGFLTMASQKGVFDILVGAVNTFGIAFKKNVTDTLVDGSLDRAFEGLGVMLDNLAKGFADLVKNGIRVFAAAAPGVNSFLRDLTGFFNRFNWERLGKSVGGVFEGLGQALRDVDEQTLRDIEDAFDKISDTFKDKDFQANLKEMVKGIAPALRQLNELTRFFGDLGAGISDAIQWLDKADQKFKSFLDWWNQSNKSDNGAGILTADAQWWKDLMDQWDRIIQGVKDKWEELKKVFGGGFSDSPSPISTLLGSIDNGGFDWGSIASDIIGGLIDGITGGLGSIARVFVSLAKAGINAAKGAFGISSPSTVFIAIGEDVTAGLEQGIRNGSAAVVAAIQELAAALASALNLTGFGEAFGREFLKMVGTARLGMDAIAQTIIDKMARIQAAFSFTGVGTSLGAAFIRLYVITAQGMERIANTVAIGMLGVAAAFDFTNVGASLDLAFQGLYVVTAQGMAQLGDTVAIGMLGVVAAFNFTGVNDLIGQAFLGLVGTVRLGMQSIAVAVTEGMPAIIAAFNFTNVSLAIGLAFQSLLGTVRLGMASIAVAVTEGMALVNAAFNFTNVGLQIGLAFLGIIGTVRLGMASIAAAVNEGMPAIIAAFNFLPVQTAVGQAFLAIVGTTNLGMTSIAVAVEAGMARVRAAIIGGVVAITPPWVAAWASMVAAVASSLASVVAAVSGGMANVLATIRGAITGILGFWRSNWQLIVGAVQTANDQLNGVVRGGMAVLQGLIRGGLSGAVAAARGFAGQFSAVGSALMQGLRSGILGAAGSIAAAAVDVVRRAINAAKAVAGIASPSRVFREIGSYMGEGLALGMEGSTSRVELAADRMADAAVDAVDRIESAFSGDAFAGRLSTNVAHSFTDLAAASSNRDLLGQQRIANGELSQSTVLLSAIVTELRALRAQAGKGDSVVGATASSRRVADLGAF